MNFRNWFDGSKYQEIYDTKQRDNAIPYIPLVLYYDELEPNSLGGSPAMKRVMVYFTVGSLPTELQGKLKSIHLVACAYSSIKEKYGPYGIGMLWTI